MQRGVIGTQLYAEGVNTLGLGAPAGRLATYTKAIPGETYAFGDGNFSTVMSDTNKYATIANGLLVGTNAAPAAGSGIYSSWTRLSALTSSPRAIRFLSTVTTSFAATFERGG